MPSKKKKYNARFPPGRIKKIMQTDEEVGKVAQAVPIIISRTLELFVHSLLTKTMQITSAKQAKTLSPAHMKQCIQSEHRFDFLKDLVKNIPDVSQPDDEPLSTGPFTFQPITINNAPMATFAPKATTVVVNDSSDNASLAQKPQRRNSKDSKRSNAKPTKEPEIAAPTSNNHDYNNATALLPPAPAQFNPNQPNFYTEVNNTSDLDAPRCSSLNRPLTMFACAASLDEDYDT